eukprot:jgi/Ulvmu1/4130/UM019_0109.1
MRRVTRSVTGGRDAKTTLAISRATLSERPLAAKLSKAVAKKKLGKSPEKSPSAKSKAPKSSPGRKTSSPKSTKKATLPIAATPDLLEKAQRLQNQLHELYPSPDIPLDSSSHFQLLIAVMLSAQTTDKKVNEVTPALFQHAPDAAALALADVAHVQSIIREIGLAPTKAKNIIATAKLLVEQHSGEVPKTFEELEALPGVGHKTASVIMSQCHGLPAFPVDTHIHRLATRWGLSSGINVVQTEADLKALFPEEHWNALHLQIIYFGREHCPARSHDPQACPICVWASQ